MSKENCFFYTAVNTKTHITPFLKLVTFHKENYSLFTFFRILKIMRETVLPPPPRLHPWLRLGKLCCSMLFLSLFSLTLIKINLYSLTINIIWGFENLYFFIFKISTYYVQNTFTRRVLRVKWAKRIVFIPPWIPKHISQLYLWLYYYKNESLILLWVTFLPSYKEN